MGHKSSSLTLLLTLVLHAIASGLKKIKAGYVSYNKAAVKVFLLSQCLVISTLSSSQIFAAMKCHQHIFFRRDTEPLQQINATEAP